MSRSFESGFGQGFEMEDEHVCQGKKVCWECDYWVVVVCIWCEVGTLGESIRSIGYTGLVHERDWVFFPFCDVSRDAGANFVRVSVVL
jgi:hypothetical protein